MLDYSQILPNLFVGSCPTKVIDLKQIRLLGVTGVLNLQTDADFEKWKIDWPLIEKTSYALDIVIQRVPINDFDDDDLQKQLMGTVNLLDRMLSVGHKIYIHCTAGQERAPTITTAYLVFCKAMSVEQASNMLINTRKCNPKVHIIQNLIDNPL